MSLEVRHITVRMGSVWKEMEAKALSSLGGTTWDVSEPCTEMKPNCSGRKKEGPLDQNQISPSEDTRGAERP